MITATALRAQIEQWERDIVRAQAAIDAARPLLDHLDDDAEPEPEPAPPPKPKRPAKKAAAKKKTAAKRSVPITCPDCGQTGFNSPQQLGAHRRHQHPGSAAKPSKPVRVVPDPEPEPVDPAAAEREEGKPFFVCSTCDEEFGTPDGIRSHTMAKHQRVATPDERTAVAA